LPPLGCHRSRIPDRIVFEKLVQILVFGCAYERIADGSCSESTLRRRRDEWIELGVMERLRRICLDAYDRLIGLELSEVAVDGCVTKAPCGGTRRAKWEKSAILNDHRKIEEGEQEAAIAAFLIAHEGHTREVEIQRGAWTIYCRCKRCEDVRTYEVDNEARERALGLAPWPEDMQKRGQDNPC
jgi:hypothetical protein